MLLVPLGAGRTCVGELVLVRWQGRPRWSEADREIALGLGHDLGRAVDNACSYARERRLVERLQELHTCKSRMITALAEELRAPVAQMRAAVRSLGRTAGNGPEVGAMERNAERAERTIEDLALLVQVRTRALR